MAKWVDAQGVYHDTDNLAYGDQGDTRYWVGTPGTVGSQTLDRPKEQGGAQVTSTVVQAGGGGAAPVAVTPSGQTVAITASGFVPPTAVQAAQQSAQQAQVAQQPQPQAVSRSGGEPVAMDGQRLSTQPADVQTLFRSTYGDAAAEMWVSQHNAAVLAAQNTVSQTGSTGTGVATVAGSGSAGGGTTSTGSDVTQASMGAVQSLQAWIQANPLAAVVIAAIAGSILLGKRR